MPAPPTTPCAAPPASPRRDLCNGGPAGALRAPGRASRGVRPPGVGSPGRAASPARRVHRKALWGPWGRPAGTCTWRASGGWSSEPTGRSLGETGRARSGQGPPTPLPARGRPRLTSAARAWGLPVPAERASLRLRGQRRPQVQRLLVQPVQAALGLGGGTVRGGRRAGPSGAPGRRSFRRTCPTPPPCALPRPLQPRGLTPSPTHPGAPTLLRPRPAFSPLSLSLTLSGGARSRSSGRRKGGFRRAASSSRGGGSTTYLHRTRGGSGGAGPVCTHPEGRARPTCQGQT